jgi:hypothetical protein
MKQNSGEYDTAVSEETVNPEALPETAVGPISYPAMKARVRITCSCWFVTNSLISGQYDHHDHTPPSCDVRQADI